MDSIPLSRNELDRILRLANTAGLKGMKYEDFGVNTKGTSSNFIELVLSPPGSIPTEK